MDRFKQLRSRLLNMPKADKGATGKSPGKQEVDAETRVVTSLAELWKGIG